MKKNLSYIYLICVLVNTSQAQMAMDTIRLPEVKLIESKIATHDVGTNIDVIKTNSLFEGSSINLANLISSSSSIYIKKYGALATPTFRGTSSSHTLVLWNGIPINSVANGLADLSAIYCHNFSEILIVNGGHGSIFGSGAIGGSLHLNSNVKEDETNKLLVWRTYKFCI
jgi:iron complex outermembrane receptor protein